MRSGEGVNLALMATFVELSPSADHGFATVPAGACDCTLELEDAGRVEDAGPSEGGMPPDLAALCRSFWNPAP